MFKMLMKITILGAAIFAADYAQAAAKSLPTQFKLKGVASGEKKAADFKNKVVVMQFWASWCVGCHEVMQKMMEVREGRPGQFDYVTVTVDENMKDAQDYFDKKHPEVKSLKSLAYLDTGTKLATSLDISSVPYIILVGSNGKILLRLHGHPSEQEWAKLGKLIDKAQPKKGANSSVKTSH